MKRTAIVSAGLAFAFLVGSTGACETPRPGGEPKGREDANTPGIVPAPKTDDQAARPADPTPGDGVPSCQTPMEAVQSVFKAVPQATVNHLAGLRASAFVAAFNAKTGGALEADEVMVILSPYYGNDLVTVFARDNCVLKTLAFHPTTPNHDDQ